MRGGSEVIGAAAATTAGVGKHSEEKSQNQPTPRCLIQVKTCRMGSRERVLCL